MVNITNISLEQLQNALTNEDIIDDIDIMADIFWTAFSQQGGDYIV